MKRLTTMLKDLITAAEAEGFKLAPHRHILPGVINADGSIKEDATFTSNRPAAGFHLPTSLVEGIPTIGDHDTAVLMHNDGVAQGLSEVPFMQEFERWGVLTIGTGLGNARFTNRKPKEKATKDKERDKDKDKTKEKGSKDQGRKRQGRRQDSTAKKAKA